MAASRELVKCEADKQASTRGDSEGVHVDSVDRSDEKLIARKWQIKV